MIFPTLQEYEGGGIRFRIFQRYEDVQKINRIFSLMQHTQKLLSFASSLASASIKLAEFRAPVSYYVRCAAHIPCMA